MDLKLDYVSNLLTLVGDPADVARAVGLLAAGSDGSGEPIGFAEVSAPATWDHEGHVAAWGCGGNPVGTVVVPGEPGSRSFTFDTPSGPPDAFAAALSRLVPALTVTLDAVWLGDPAVASLSGEWKAGAGAMAAVAPSREHWAKVRPRDEDWELDDMFAGGAGPAP